MTDKEIIKALECCGDEEELHWCTECPYYDKENDFCQEDLHRDALDLISRQQAEIERLQNESIGNCELAISMRNDNNLKGDCSYCIDKAKAEAIKEFAERLQEKADDIGIDEDGFLFTISAEWKTWFRVGDWCEEIINNLVKEMVGGK